MRRLEGNNHSGCGNKHLRVENDNCPDCHATPLDRELAQLRGDSFFSGESFQPLAVGENEMDHSPGRRR